MNELPARRNIKLVIAYDGRAYHGWQRQADGVDSVQQQVEDVATRVMRHKVIVFGAGRTDAGVHADGQVANFYTTNFAIPLTGMRKAINSRLPRDIFIRSAVEVPDHFHASRSAIGKTYRYRICVSPQRPVKDFAQVYHYWRTLNVEPMQEAALRLLGEHDFRGFATSSEVRENTVRTIYRCEVRQDGPEIVVSVEGDGFLYNMVRNIVGTLMDIGRGRNQPELIDKILSSRDRRDAGPTAAPDGLSMVCVHYRPEDLVLNLHI